jgi:hypothetical protein
VDELAFPLRDLRSAGTAYLYVLPCVAEDLAKLGHSRDPLARMQALHPRWFEFFDLERAWAVEVDRVRDARALERAQAHALAVHRAPAPLTARRAHGVTEWYRGATVPLAHAAARYDAEGHRVLRPLRDWLAPRMALGGDLLHDWVALLDPLALEARGAAAVASLAQRRVVDVLDGYVAFGLALDRWLPAQVLDWHAEATRYRPLVQNAALS